MPDLPSCTRYHNRSIRLSAALHSGNHRNSADHPQLWLNTRPRRNNYDYNDPNMNSLIIWNIKATSWHHKRFLKEHSTCADGWRHLYRLGSDGHQSRSVGQHMTWPAVRVRSSADIDQLAYSDDRHFHITRIRGQVASRVHSACLSRWSAYSS